MGVVCGLVFAVVCAWLGNLVARPAVYIALTVAGSFGSYYVSSLFGWSGIFAVLAFGVAVRAWWQDRIGESSSQSVEKFWDAVATVANALLFFLIGAALDVSRLGSVLPVSLLIAVIVLAARYAIVHGLLEFARPRLHVKWLTVLRLAGVRGALSLALALAIPAGFAQRQLVIDATFVVVVVTLAVALPLGRRSGDVPVDGVENNLG